MLRSSTVTCGTGSPVGSLTVPTTEADSNCAKPATEMQITNATNAATRLNVHPPKRKGIASQLYSPWRRLSQGGAEPRYSNGIHDEGKLVQAMAPRRAEYGNLLKACFL